MPVLGGLLLTAKAGRLTVSGFDFGTAARVGAEAEVTAALHGAETVAVAFHPAYRLDALNSFEGPGLPMELRGSGQRVLLGGGGRPQAHRNLLMSVRQLA